VHARVAGQRPRPGEDPLAVGECVLEEHGGAGVTYDRGGREAHAVMATRRCPGSVALGHVAPRFRVAVVHHVPAFASGYHRSATPKLTTLRCVDSVTPASRPRVRPKS